MVNQMHGTTVKWNGVFGGNKTLSKTRVARFFIAGRVQWYYKTKTLIAEVSGTLN